MHIIYSTHFSEVFNLNSSFSVHVRAFQLYFGIFEAAFGSRDQRVHFPEYIRVESAGSVERKDGFLENSRDIAKSFQKIVKLLTS